MSRRYLFLCFENKNRSVTGERVFKLLASQRGYSVGSLEQNRGYDLYAGSAGVGVVEEESGKKKFRKRMLRGLDVLFVSDDLVEWHLKRFAKVNRRNFSGQMVNLAIPDVYDISKSWQEDQLYEIFREKLAHYLPEKKS